MDNRTTLFLCVNSNDIFIHGYTSLVRERGSTAEPRFIVELHNSSRSYSLARKTESMGRPPSVRTGFGLIIMVRIISGIRYRCTRS